MSVSLSIIIISPGLDSRARTCPFHKLELREISELPTTRMLGSCAFYLFIRVMEITDILSQNVPLEDVQYLAGHSNPSGHTDL